MAKIDSALTTLARAKQYLGISDSSKDFRLTMRIVAASKAIENYCNRTFKRTTYTNEILSGKDSSRIYLKNSPVIDGQPFTMERTDDFDTDTSWDGISSEDYQVDNAKGVIQKDNGNFRAGNRNYRVTYTAGYYLPSADEFEDDVNDELDLPADIEMAVLTLLEADNDSQDAGNIKRQKVNQVEIEYDLTKTASNELIDNEQVKAMLAPYVRKGYVF